MLSKQEFRDYVERFIATGERKIAHDTEIADALAATDLLLAEKMRAVITAYQKVVDYAIMRTEVCDGPFEKP